MADRDASALFIINLAADINLPDKQEILMAAR
jgi:hypothetical protein